MGRKHLLQKLGLSLILPLTITAAAYAQNNYPSNGTKPPPPAIQKMPPTNSGNIAPSLPGICPETRRIGPFLTSDEAELAAQSARYQVIQTSSIYSQGFPDSELNPPKYYFDVYILTPCH
jgi:hypothetical protein